MTRIARVAAVLVIVALHVTVHAQEGMFRGTVVVSGTQQLRGDEGHLLMLAGRVDVTEAARVEGSAIVLGDTLEVHGWVGGDIVLIGGHVTLGPSARVGGRMIVAGGVLERASGSVVVGGVSDDLSLAAELVRPAPSTTDRVTTFAIQSMMLAVLAYLLARFIPGTLTRVAGALTGHPAVAIAMGGLSGLVAVVLVVIMTYTIVLIPVALIGAVLGVAAVALGWIACGLALGSRLAAMRGWPLRAPSAAFLGTLLFMTVLAILELVPVVGSLVGLLLTVGGLGAVLVTGFGTRAFVADAERQRAHGASLP